MEELLKQLIEGQKQLFEGQKQITQRLDNIEGNISTIEGDISTIKTTMSTKSDITELNQLVHAVSLEVIDETHKVESKLDVLNSRLFNQEAELQRLKLAK